MAASQGQQDGGRCGMLGSKQTRNGRSFCRVFLMISIKPTPPALVLKSQCFRVQKSPGNTAAIPSSSPKRKKKIPRTTVWQLADLLSRWGVLKAMNALVEEEPCLLEQYQRLSEAGGRVGNDASPQADILLALKKHWVGKPKMPPTFKTQECQKRTWARLDMDEGDKEGNFSLSCRVSCRNY